MACRVRYELHTRMAMQRWNMLATQSKKSRRGDDRAAQSEYPTVADRHLGGDKRLKLDDDGICMAPELASRQSASVCDTLQASTRGKTESGITTNPENHNGQ